MKKKKYHIITIGCQMNKSDSERVAGYLEGLDFVWTPKKEQADVVVTTTCGVRQSAEDRVYGLVPKIKKENPRAVTVVTGCLSGRADVQKRLKASVDIWLPIIDLPKLEKLLNRKQNFRSQTSKIEVRLRKDGSVGGYLAINPKHESRISAFVPIGNGCNNFCAYCVVPYARGREVYRPAEEILAEVSRLVDKGYKEITLIAQNVNSYNFQFSIFNFKNSNFKIDSKFEIRSSKLFDQNKIVKVIDFPILLRLVNAIPGNFWIRFATSHPKDVSEELIKTIAGCSKVCRQIHLPVQAGDNEVLRRMNRKYTRTHYLGLVKKIRRAMPDAAISTDVIVGFPGESKAQFEQTAKLFREARFDMAYTAQYSPRPVTAAYKFKDDVPKREKKRREEALTKILTKTALENNKKYLGKTVEAMIAGQSKGGYFGKTKTGKNVKIKTSKGDGLRAGDFVDVKIDEIKDFGLSGRLVHPVKCHKAAIPLRRDYFTG